MLRWTTLVPLASLVVLAVAWVTHPEEPLGVTVVGVFLVAAVLAAVHHAEVIAHRVGDPVGSLILAVAVTIIEVALIVTLMVSGSDHASTLARDTVFAAVMLSINGIVGCSLLVCALRHHLAVFNPEGTGSALATVITLSGLTLVLPKFTVSEPGRRSRRRSSRSRRWSRSPSTPSSSSPRPCDTATSSWCRRG